METAEITAAEPVAPEVAAEAASEAIAAVEAAARGEVVDALVTEFGVTINPRRTDLIDACKEAGGVPLVPIDELVAKAHEMSGPMEPVAQKDRIVGVIEWRDGTVIDVVRQLG